MPKLELDDTIAAIATPTGEGGIAVIRISGDEAIDVAAKVFSGPVQNYFSHTPYFVITSKAVYL